MHVLLSVHLASCGTCRQEDTGGVDVEDLWRKGGRDGSAKRRLEQQVSHSNCTYPLEVLNRVILREERHGDWMSEQTVKILA